MRKLTKRRHQSLSKDPNCSAYPKHLLHVTSTPCRRTALPWVRSCATLALPTAPAGVSAASDAGESGSAPKSCLKMSGSSTHFQGL